MKAFFPPTELNNQCSRMEIMFKIIVILISLPCVGGLVSDIVFFDGKRNIQWLLPANTHRRWVDESHRNVFWSGRNRTCK